jgi:predicted Zn-dependent protease
VAPFNPFIRKNLAEALYNSGSKADATNELLRAVDIEPNYVPGYFRLSEWYAEAGQNLESEQYRNTAIQVALKYQDRKSLDTYEALLLGRPVTDKPE